MTISKAAYMRFFYGCLGVYVVALVSSMAAMETFGWLSILLFLGAYLLKFIPKPLHLRLEPALWLLGLGSVAVVGILTNHLGPRIATELLASLRWMIFFYLLFLAMQSLSVAQVERWLPRFLLGATFVAVYGIVQHFTGIDLFRGHAQHNYGKYWRVTGFFGFPLTYAYSFTMIALVALGMALSHHNQRRRLVLYTFEFGAIAISVVMSYTRGAWIGLVVGCAILSALFGGRAFKRFVMSAVLLITPVLAMNDSIRGRFLSLFDLSFYSNAERFNIWRANWQIFLDHPLWGVGYGRNDFLLGEYLNRIGVEENFIAHAHSNYLQMLSGVGFFGFVFFMLFSLSLFVMSLRVYRRIPANQPMEKGFVLGAIGAQASLHVGGLTECNFKDMEVNHLFLMMMVLVILLAIKYRAPQSLLPVDHLTAGQNWDVHEIKAR